MLDGPSHNRLDARLNGLLELLCKGERFGVVAAEAEAVVESVAAKEGEGPNNKLIRPGWKRAWKIHGGVMWAWFPDPRNDAIAQALTTLFTKLFAFILADTPAMKQRNTSELQFALEDYLQRRAYATPSRQGSVTLPASGQGEGTDAKADTGHLKPSREKAYRLYELAIERDPNLKTDQAVYDWLAVHSDTKDELPIFATWTKYLREARAYRAVHKRTPKRGKKATGKSVVRHDQI